MHVDRQAWKLRPTVRILFDAVPAAGRVSDRMFSSAVNRPARSLTMRKMYVVAAAFVVTLAGFSTIRADDRPQQNGSYTSNGYSSSTPPRTYRYYRGGVFDRLLEMERRTNAWPFGRFRR
jgi:hypothetical protein